MPLHLLGKKSWNVYNEENVARVRRDEAEAQAREEEHERRLQEIDAQRRLSILRGVTPPPLPDQGGASEVSHDRKKRDRSDIGREDYKKRRRLKGEDDTDRDIRLAKEGREMAERAREGLSGGTGATKKATSDAPIIDHAGHIDLFPEEKASKGIKGREKNAEAEKEAEKKRREIEDQYTMRFSNAAGYKEGMEKPWYASKRNEASVKIISDEVGKDVWGNRDPGRNERTKIRIASNDPMAFMQKAQTQLKEAERDRKRVEEERQRGLDDLRMHPRRKEKRIEQEDDLEGFSLDAPAEKERPSRHRHSHHRRRSKDRGQHHGQRHRRRSKASRSKSPI